MNTNPQIWQITQKVDAERCIWGYKGFQTDACQPCLYHLCNLRNLRIGVFQENL